MSEAYRWTPLPTDIKQVAELQQQITELTFYLKTQRQIDQSPQSQKDELRSGTLVATQQEPNSSLIV